MVKFRVRTAYTRAAQKSESDNLETGRAKQTQSEQKEGDGREKSRN